MKNFETVLSDLIKPIVEKMVDEKIQSFFEDNKADADFTVNDKLPITSEILAKRMGLSKSFIYQEVSKGNIPYHKRCKRLYFIPSEIKDWVTGKWKKPSKKTITLNTGSM
jgi:predicted DNA-binding transcriptional regulator AlpA